MIKLKICINQAKYIAAKYGINFMFDDNPDNYVPIEDSEEDGDMLEQPVEEEVVSEEIEDL